MSLLPLTAPDSDIKKLVVAWTELLASEDYQGALALIGPASEAHDWTPASLKACINGYGVVDVDEQTLRDLLDEYEVSAFTITSLRERPDRERIIEDAIEVDRENLYGMRADRYLGMVHFTDLPLSGYLSDLTARFNIVKAGQNRLALEFIDIHVM